MSTVNERQFVLTGSDLAELMLSLGAAEYVDDITSLSVSVSDDTSGVRFCINGGGWTTTLGGETAL
jgi:hypothetical protein